MNRTPRSTADTNHPSRQGRRCGRPDGARLREGLIDPNNAASEVWADSAHRFEADETHLGSIGKVSRIHRRKPRNKSMSKRVAKANAPPSSLPSLIGKASCVW
jgi:hypothetical protein